MRYPPIPSKPGSYALHLRLTSRLCFDHEKLGKHSLSPGDFVYLGSAHGLGGLSARLGRHIRGDGKPKWHIDILRESAEVISAYCLLQADRSGQPPLECAWSQVLAQSPNNRVPIPGFGSSDCVSGCQAHLIALNIPSSKKNLMKLLIGQLRQPLINDPSEIVCIENILRYNG
jgi:Uri superfamily endonuclease